MLTKDTHPYELLVRWDRDGQLAGAHVGFRAVVREDGEIIHEREEPAMPVDVGQGKGFPLADILGTTEATALARVATLDAEKAALEAERDRLQAEKAALEAERDRRAEAAAVNAGGDAP